MAVKIVGLLYVAIGIWGIIHTYINRNQMPVSLFGMQRTNFEVTDSESLNRLLLLRGYTIAAVLIITGIVGIITELMLVILLGSLVNFVNLGFTHAAKKYLSLTTTK